MKNYKIGFGYTKNVGNYENSKIYIEAHLEDWENPEETINLLRTKIAQEIELPDIWHDLRAKVRYQQRTLDNLNLEIKAAEQKLEQARRQWDNFAEFLTGHGVDPTTLTIENFEAQRQFHSGIPTQETIKEENPHEDSFYEDGGEDDYRYREEEEDDGGDFDPYPSEYYDD